MDPSDPINLLPLVGSVYEKRLKKLGIEKVEDMLMHLPHRYIDYRSVSDLTNISPGDTITVQGTVTSAKNQYTKQNRKIQLVEIQNGAKTISAVWFNQPYLIRSFPIGTEVSLAGTVQWFGRKLALVSPEFEKVTHNLVHTGRLLPVYPETAGVSSKWLRRRISDLFENNVTLPEYLPDKIREKYNLIKINEALNKIHFPLTLLDAELGRRRLAFDELLLLHIESLKRKTEWRRKRPTYSLSISEKLKKDFVSSLPFELTTGQKLAVEEIYQDLLSDIPMNRLLQGDVGAGKTVVAAAGVFAAFTNGFQSIVMAPTQVLSQQHFETLNKLFEKYRARITLVTSEGVVGSIGKVDIFVGTHALLYNKVTVDESALVVIDEQHRFGVKQRAALSESLTKSSKTPHVLTMTATPIPRTIALTLYGDLSVSVLNELPQGRQKITTWIVPPEKRDGAYNWIAREITTKKVQAFVICPLIEESDAETMKEVKAATAEFERLKRSLPHIKLGLLHGKLSARLKNQVLSAFRRGEIDVLVSTPVVEVGIDIPNATIMVVEAAERFGLAQLHQLRGRVGRGEKKSYCLLFTESEKDKTQARLAALKENISGFELAEIDLKMRGPGELFGTLQSGFPELKIANWMDIELIKSTRECAEELLENTQKYPSLIEYLDKKIIAKN